MIQNYIYYINLIDLLQDKRKKKQQYYSRGFILFVYKISKFSIIIYILIVIFVICFFFIALKINCLF